MINFNIEEAGHQFRFISMNRRRLQLFQIYVTVEGQNYRYHMQVDDETGDFRITEKAHCPVQLVALEHTLSDAIKQHGGTDVIPT